MTLFLLHESNGRQDDKNLICLPDRFSWFAFLLPPVWALSNRLWFTFIAMVLFILGLNLLSDCLILPILGFYILAVLWLGVEANSIIGNSFARRGWHALNPVMAENRMRAELKYFGRIKRRVARMGREKTHMQHTRGQDKEISQDSQSVDTQSVQNGSVE